MTPPLAARAQCERGTGPEGVTDGLRGDGLGGQGVRTRQSVSESSLCHQEFLPLWGLETTPKLAQTEPPIRNTRAIPAASRVVMRMRRGHSAWHAYEHTAGLPKAGRQDSG